MSEISRIKITTPEYDEILPSTQEAIKIKPFRVADENTLLIASESKNNKQMVNAMKKIVSNSVVDDIDVEKFAPHDFEYLFLKIRAKSVGEVSKLKIPCSHCETKNEVDFDLESVEVHQDEKFSNILTINDRLSFQMKYLNLEDVMAMDPDIKQSEMFNVIAQAIDVIVYEDETINVGKAERKEAQDLIESLTSKDFEKFVKYFELMPHVRGIANFTCSNCGQVNDHEIRGMQNFF